MLARDDKVIDVNWAAAENAGIANDVTPTAAQTKADNDLTHVSRDLGTVNLAKGPVAAAVGNLGQIIDAVTIGSPTAA